MKKIIFFLLFLFFYSSAVYSQWHDSSNNVYADSKASAFTKKSPYSVGLDGNYTCVSTHDELIGGTYSVYQTCTSSTVTQYKLRYWVWLGSCPAPLILDTTVDYGDCVTAPSSCPPSGEKHDVQMCQKMSSGGSTFLGDVTGSFDSDGCGWSDEMGPVKSEGYGKDDSGNEYYCQTRERTSSGNTSSQPQTLEDPANVTENTKKETQEYTKDVTPTNIVDDNGVEVKTENQTETISKPTYERNSTTEYVRRDGDLIEKETTTVTRTNPDGSVSITHEVEYRETTGEEVKFDKNNNVVSKYPPSTKTSGTNTTTNKDSSGKVISTASTGFGGAGTDNGSITGGNKGTSGTDSDPGEDENQEDCNNCTFDGEQPGLDGLYTPTDKTFDSVLTDFKTTVMTTGAIAAANNFFTISLPSGSCPVWSAAIPYINIDLVIDQQCSSAMTAIWPYIQAVLLLVAGFVAFRWAFL